MSRSYTRSAALLGLSATTRERGTFASSSSRPRYDSTAASSSTRERSYTREDSREKDDSDSESQDGYVELRAKVRALQREVGQKSSRLDTLVQEKEDISVALGHAKRDKAKLVADAEQVELERDSLERENRRIKARLDSANKELKELSDERRKLTERLTVVEVLKRSSLTDEKDIKTTISKFQDEISTLRTQNLQLEEKLGETQDQLRRAKIAATPVPPVASREPVIAVVERRAGSTADKIPQEDSLEDSSPAPMSRVTALSLAGVRRERSNSVLRSSSEVSPPNTPTYKSGSLSARLGSPHRPTEAFRIEHLKVELESAKKELSRLQDNNSDLTKKLKEAESTLHALKSEHRSLESRESSQAAAAKSATKKAEDAEARRKEALAENVALKEAEEKAKAAVEQAHRDLSRAKEEAAAIRLQLEKAETTVKKETEAKKKLNDQLTALQKELSSKELERKELTRSASKSVIDLQGHREEMSHLEAKQAKLEREVQALTSQATQLTTELQEKQAALDVALIESRTQLDKISKLTASLKSSEDAQKKAHTARKAAEDETVAIKQKLVEKENVLEASASDHERRKADLELQLSEVAHLKSNVAFLERSIEDAKQNALKAASEASEAKHQLDHANAELQAASLTISQLERDLASQQQKAITAAAAPSLSTSSTSSIPDAQTELKLRELAEKLAAAQKGKNEAESKLVAAETEKSKTWADLKQLQTELNRAKADLQMGGRIVQDLQAKLKEAQDKVVKSDADAKSLAEKQERVSDELRGLLGNAKKELKIKDGILATKDASIADLTQRLKDSQQVQTNGNGNGNGNGSDASSPSSAERDTLQKKLDETQKDLEAIQSALTSTKHESATRAMRIQSQQSTIDSLQAKLAGSASSTPPIVSVSAGDSDKAELDKLRRELELGAQVAAQSKSQLEKVQAELEKTKSDSVKQRQSDAALRKTLSKTCEHWQHQAEAYHAQLDKIKKEMAKNAQLRAVLEPIVGTAVSPTTSAAATPHDDRTNKVIKIQALVRGALERLRHKHWRYRYLKVKEMVDTEETYLKALDLGWNYFLNPLQTMIKVGDPIINQEGIDVIFSTLEQIRKNNKELLTMLKARLNTWHVDQLVGDVFNDALTNKKLLQPHVDFIQAYSKSTEGRMRLTKEIGAFSQLLAVIRMLPPMEGRSLEDILINPIQRIPRYILLLNDMLKHTPEHHPDFQNLQTAASAFQNFATFINENNRRAETMTDINLRLIGYELLPENAERKLIHEGRLTQLGPSKNEKIPRYVFLFNDVIVFGKDSNKKKKSASVKSASPAETLRGVTSKYIAMIKIGPTVSVSEIGSRDVNGAMQTCLLSIMVGESPNLLQAASESDMKLWVGKIKEAIEEQKRDKSPSVERRHSFQDNPSPAPKDRSKRLSVGSSSSASGTKDRAVSPARASSHNSLVSASSSSSIPEDSISISPSQSAVEIPTTVSAATPPLGIQASHSSGSLDGKTEKKRTTLAKRHKDRPRSQGPGEN